MLSAYPACFFIDEPGYTVVFPDLNYLATCGATVEDALSMAVDCLAGYLYLSAQSNETIPPASSVDNIDISTIANELEISPNGAFVNIVTVDVAEYAKLHFEKSVKKTLSIPAWLNNAALEQNINFSKVLQEALLLKLGYVCKK